MTRHVHWWRPLRVVIGAAVLGFCWFILAPSSAHAEDRPTGVLGGTAAAVTEGTARSTAKVTTAITSVTDGGAGTASRATGAVASATERTPVARPVQATTKAVDAVVSRSTTSVTTVVRSTSATVAKTVGDTAKAVSGTVAVIEGSVDEVTAPVAGIVADTPDQVIRPQSSTPADSGSPSRAERAGPALADRLTRLHAQRVELAEAALAVAVAPAAVLTSASPVATAIVTAATSRPSGPVLPLPPLSYLASALVVAAVGSSFSGRGSPTPADAVLTPVSLMPQTAADTMRSLAARALPGPVLIPGTCPD